MRRLTLAQRVSLAAGTSVLVVLAGHTLLTGRATSAQVRAWEREEVSAMAHHVADMVDANPPSDVARSIADTASNLRAFGIDLRYSATGAKTDDRSVAVPLKGNRGFIVARATDDLSRTLRARLRRSSVMLTLGVLAALLVAVEGAVFWGAVLPLRRVQSQLDRMSRGPWHIDAEVGGGKEVAELSQKIAAVGAQLERSIGQWVEAERRAASENLRMELRSKSIPILRELNLAASNLCAQGALSAEGTRAVRRMLAAADQVGELLKTSIDSQQLEPGSTGRAGGNTPVRAENGEVKNAR